MKLTRKRLTQTILTLLLAAGVLSSLFNFLQGNSRRIASQNEEYLNELTAQRAISIDNLIDENLSFIQATAYLYGQSLTSPEADVNMIREYEENTVFDMLRFVDTLGDNYTSAGLQANLADREYVQAGLRGEAGVTYVLQSRVTGERQIGFYAPVYYDQKILGVMVGFFGEEYVTRLLEYELFGQDGAGWLCTAEGITLGETAAPRKENFLAELAEGNRCAPETLEALRQAMTAGQSQSFTYWEGTEEVAGYAVPLKKADWVLIRSFPPAASQQILRNANREGIKLIASLVVLFAAFGFLIGVGVILDQRRTREANRNANDVTTGVSRLFEKFVTLDLETGEYRYIGGDPESGLEESGAYDQFQQALLGKIPDPDQRAETARAIRLERLREMLEKQESVSVRAHAPSEGAEWFTYNFIVLERAEGKPLRALIVRQDVTALRHKEEKEQQALQEALDAAEQASRAKTEFLFNMSHDLRTPMNAIIGYTELAEREGTTPEETRNYVRKIGASGKHLLSLINDILEMSRIESGKISLAEEPVLLTRLCEEARDMFSTQMAEKGIHFQVDASQVRQGWVWGDENKLNRVLLNLISNAYKFTARGGEIAVRLTEAPGQKENENVYELRVRDTGIGMSEEFQKKLFTPFERERTSTVSKTQGTGLGLSITKEFVEMMGGTIRAESVQGEGTEFIVRVPLRAAPPAEEEQPAPAQETKLDFSQVRLLLVEDNEINREIASMILTTAGFQLDTAENGQQAVDRVQAAPVGTYQAVLMDIQMPVMDGYTAAQTIRALPEPEKAHLPIIAMTANAFQEDVQAALAAGMDGHIAKPLDVGRMMETLTGVLQKGSKQA